MRKHDVRKWLHAILDLLPVIIIPVFMIYSHRHTIDSYEVTRDKYDVVNFNQQAENYYVNYDNVSFNRYDRFLSNTFDSSIQGHKVYYSFYCVTDLTSCYYCIGHPGYQPNGSSVLLDPNTTFYEKLTTFNVVEGGWYSSYFYNFNAESNKTCIISDLMFFDLTKMYGAGNEPSTIAEFRDVFDDTYYQYTLSRKMIINTGTETFNDTDIGSQLLYAMYNPVDKYFNFNKVGTFNSIYQWFSLNFFNGNPPLVTPIIWNIILYEFIMDVLFLTYSVFMFIIDFIECALDKAFGKSYRGGR